MEELTYADLEKIGVSTSNIAVCKRLRRLAKLDRVTLDQNEHRSGLNKHLFDYIMYYGLDVLQFIKEYLSNLQPYMIERRKDQEFDSHVICVIDNLYRVSVYIKVDATQYEEAVVSFHEDNKRGVAKANSLVKIDAQRHVPIFADYVLSESCDDAKYVVKGLFQRGLKTLPLELVALKCQDVFIVEKDAINLQFVSYCNDYIRDLYTSDLNLDFDTIEVFSMLQQISHTSYGKDTFSSISLLIDSLCIQKDSVSKSVADFALVTFVSNLKLTEEQRNELIELLEQKYKVTSIQGTDLILNRVKEYLSISFGSEEM